MNELKLSHVSARQVILWWNDVVDESSYEVYRMHEGESDFHPFSTTEQNDNSYVNSWIRAGAKVNYKVRAVNEYGNSAWSPIMSTTASSRNDGEYLKIKRMKFSKDALRAVESWVCGDPEIRLRVVVGTESGNAVTVFESGVLEPDRRSDIENQWWEREEDIGSWHTANVGTVLTFDWREEDWYSGVSFSITGSYEDKNDDGLIKSSGSINYEDDEGSGHIGTKRVLWWEQKDHTYNLSGFEWEFVH